MDPGAVTLITLLVACVSGLSALGGAWIRGRAQERRAREDARRNHVHHLPPGSRVIDLGANGMVIEIGGQGPGREAPLDGTR